MGSRGFPVRAQPHQADQTSWGPSDQMHTYSAGTVQKLNWIGAILASTFITQHVNTCTTCRHIIRVALIASHARTIKTAPCKRATKRAKDSYTCVSASSRALGFIFRLRLRLRVTDHGTHL